MRVIFADWLTENFDTFDDNIRLSVVTFAVHVETYGLRKLIGRNKSSADIPFNVKSRDKKIKFAQKYCLWHFHLGIPQYIEQADGEMTSEYLLHYIRYEEFIVLVDVAKHPPFRLPNRDKLTFTA